MKLERENYHLFRLGDGQLVAIDRENHKVLEHCLSIWKELSRVPVDRTVRGVFVKRTNGDLQSLEDAVQQNDITINQLRPVES